MLSCINTVIVNINPAHCTTVRNVYIHVHMRIICITHPPAMFCTALPFTTHRPLSDTIPQLSFFSSLSSFLAVWQVEQGKVESRSLCLHTRLSNKSDSGPDDCPKNIFCSFGWPTGPRVFTRLHASLYTQTGHYRSSLLCAQNVWPVLLVLAATKAPHYSMIITPLSPTTHLTAWECWGGAKGSPASCEGWLTLRFPLPPLLHLSAIRGRFLLITWPLRTLTDFRECISINIAISRAGAIPVYICMQRSASSLLFRAQWSRFKWFLMPFHKLHNLQDS